jgi:hypothetical protein
MKIFWYSLVLFIIAACNTNKTETKPEVIFTDSLSGKVIADTIIYDVIIKNTNPDDYWTEECLQYLKREDFIDSLFHSLYKKNLIAYDFFSGEKLSLKDIKALEKSDWYSREAIGKLQFTEVWTYNNTHNIMNKKVLSIVMGVEQFNNLRELKGYKPLFKIKLN